MKRKITFLLICMLVGFSGCGEEVTPKQEEAGQVLSQVPYDRISAFLWNQALETYTEYYQLMGFKISDYEEEEEARPYEAVLHYTVFYKNHEKDPDTVEYIKAAKEKNDPNYQILYDEYLMEKEMNMEIKAVIEEDGEVLLYSDENPTTERLWTQFHMEQTILKE